MTVLAATRWPTNGHMIADLARLGVITKDMVALDPTYGHGTWWKLWRPDDLTTHVNDIDFRDLPYDDESFDLIAFDPPYCAMGGRQTSTIPDYNERYGRQVDEAQSPESLQQMINDGLDEMHRALRKPRRGEPPGICLVKCQDYITSGKFWPGSFYTQRHAMGLFEVVDKLERVGSPRPQPPGRRQLHARRNISTLFVLRRMT